MKYLAPIAAGALASYLLAQALAKQTSLDQSTAVGALWGGSILAGLGVGMLAHVGAVPSLLLAAAGTGAANYLSYSFANGVNALTTSPITTSTTSDNLSGLAANTI